MANNLNPGEMEPREGSQLKKAKGEERILKSVDVPPLDGSHERGINNDTGCWAINAQHRPLGEPLNYQ